MSVEKGKDVVTVSPYLRVSQSAHASVQILEIMATRHIIPLYLFALPHIGNKNSTANKGGNLKANISKNVYSMIGCTHVEGKQ